MTVLVLGGNGQVGFELRRSLAPLGTIVAPTRAELDLMDAGAVDALLKQQRPAVIVNAAAWTAVDAAESSPEEARRLNAGLPEQLAAHAIDSGAVLVHYSSDYVYPGNGETPWTEESPTGPLSVYGASKLAGDEAVAASDATAIVFRTSWVYSARGGNFLKTMLRLGREREALNVVSDQVGAPTPARLIAEVTLLALQGLRQGTFGPGLYHLAPRGETSWHGFAEAIFAAARARGETLAIADASLGAIPTRDYPTPAQRPLNSRLSLDKLERELGIELPSWQTQLELTLDEALNTH
ncbi:dTDP-4-dehydrorhamnose reductase [Salinicola aestuarinus]|uniref:dTDP-4-dehydrorhamnose reductase n=1 Tax=Salinicola aestuarinus TaxID=1949082 RepID=UPI000DA13C59|nr:dTDP-4-dehydrorhamnose reductase [Salinicola aestuarinus]